MDDEHRRLEEARSEAAPWRKWRPYLSERQWGTVGTASYAHDGSELEARSLSLDMPPLGYNVFDVTAL